jgi:hypothetical protein
LTLATSGLGTPDAQLTVATLSGSAVATVTVSLPGLYTTTLHTNPVSVTGGHGTGATFTVVYTSSMDVYLTDGPAINQLYGEFLSVYTISGATIAFTTPTVNSYSSGLAALVPGPQPADMYFSDFGVGTSAYPQQDFGEFNSSVRIYLDRMDFYEGVPGYTAAGSNLSLNECSQTYLQDINIPLGVIEVDECRMLFIDNLFGGVGGEGEYSSDVNITSSVLTNGMSMEYIGSVRVNVSDCVIQGLFQGSDNSTYSNISWLGVSGVNPVYWHANNFVMAGVWSDSASVVFQGNGCKIYGLNCPAVDLFASSTGLILDPSSIASITNSAGAGAWYYPTLTSF